MRPVTFAGARDHSGVLLGCLAADDRHHVRRQARARPEVRQGRARHRRHRGADRAAHGAHQPPDRAPARAQARPPLAPWVADARRPPPPVPELPAEEGSRGVPLADPRARPAPLGLMVIPAGEPAPEFSLARAAGGDPFTRADLFGRTTVLVFYPFAFSPVCTDQLSVYNEVLPEFREHGATLYGVSCDAVWSQKAFKEKLGIEIEQLSDFEPKGATCRAFGVYFEKGGMPTR